MKKYLWGGVGRLVLLSLVVVVLATPSLAATPGDQLLSIGQAGPKAIELKAWAEKPKSDKYKSGDPIAIHLKASQKAYVTAIYISPEGDATVLFPNRATPENLLEAGKEYSLFDPDASVKFTVSEKDKDSKIVFYVSSKPLKLDPLAIPAGQAFMTIPNSAVKEMNNLTDKIQELAKDEGFNRTVLKLTSGPGKKMSLDFMGLPTEAKGSKPQNITGVQGLKSKILDHGKE